MLEALTIEDVDGLSMSFDTWRFNLRKSNTEPLVRLNIETRADDALLKEKTNELKLLIDQTWQKLLVSPKYYKWNS